MGFLGDLAKSAMGGLQDRANRVSERKEELERSYKYASDEEILRYMSRIPVTSGAFAALSLILQDRGYSGEEVAKMCYAMKHNH